MAVDPEAKSAELAPSVARELNQAAQRGGTEADFRREAARILENAGSAAGLTIIPRDEFSVARGRVDSVYNRLILEYKKPGILRDSNDNRANRDAIQQVKDYVLDVGKRERREAQRLAGVATDGFRYIFVRRVGEGWSVDDPIPVNAPSTERFLRLLFSLSTGAALVAENLVEDFGPKHRRTQTAVRAIYRGLRQALQPAATREMTSKSPLVGRLFEQWRIFFAEATDYKEWSERIESKPEFRAFVKSLWTAEEIRHLDAARVFFVLHTYYALLIKLVASMAVARFAGGASRPLSQIAALEGEDLRQSFKDLEDGGIFKQYGIRNFLEGDFFGWYLAAWNDDIEEGVSSLVKRLADYDPGALELAPENARDLLKKLYHYLLPREIRHDLGEYYTPDWLAERLIRQTLGLGDRPDAIVNPKTRVLDPACGSGTFLVILIKFMRRAVEKGRVAPREALEQILQNVVGFDLNPLAVIAARTNYLIALGDLLKARKGDIEIPVYQADSVLTPSRGEHLFDNGAFRLKTAVGEFLVPEVFAQRERIDVLTNALDDAVESGLGENWFLKQSAAASSMRPEELQPVENHLRALYRQLRELHDQGLNGVWARIIKNQFAPLFLEPCQFVVGNPPWVNWENLPDDYRESSMFLWKHYGLFPKRHRAMETILGAAKYDISALMTCVALDKYVRKNAKLGFVLTESLFKTSGAAQGFRRFALPGGVSFRPLIVEDMVALKPFEGASNRTTVAVFLKGQPVRYPVSYPHWFKRSAGRGSSIGFDTPYESVTTEKIAFRSWNAEPVDQKDPTSIWLTGRPKAIKAIRSLISPSHYEAREGVNSGGANAVFWLEIAGYRPGKLVVASNVTEKAKKKVPNIQAALEPDLLYPLLRAGDVRRWHATSSLHILLTHESKMRLKAIPEDVMQDRYPKIFAYLRRSESLLRKRAAFKRYFKEDAPFYSLFNIGEYSFAPWKVLWTRVGKVEAAVAGPVNGKPIIPQETITLVPCSNQHEAHFIAAVINSRPFQFALESYSQKGGKSMGSVHMLRYLHVPTFSSKKDVVHAKLAGLSAAAHKADADGDEAQLKSLEEEVDRWAAKLWGLSDEQLAEIKRSLEEM